MHRQFHQYSNEHDHVWYPVIVRLEFDDGTFDFITYRRCSRCGKVLF